MKTMKTILCASVVAGMASAASAGTISVSDIGGGILLNSGPLSATVFGNGPAAWTPASIASAHASLNASGVSTNGKITFIAADTDHGLSLMALVDQQLAEQPPIALGHVHMDTVGNAASLTYMRSLSPAEIGGSSGSQIAHGDLQWNSNGGGDAFAWAGLTVGNTMTFRFNRIAGQQLGLDDPSTFQFVTWVGDHWARINIADSLLSFTATGDWGFSATTVTIIPLPGIAGLAGLPLLALPLSRRRKA